jgi:hypothetical protein
LFADWHPLGATGGRVDQIILEMAERGCLLAIYPNSEIEDGHDGVFMGAHASGVWFLASRRKPRPANFSRRKCSK